MCSSRWARGDRVAVWAWLRPKHRDCVPAVAIALIQLSGLSVFARTHGQVATLVEQRRSAPAAFRAAEGARMDKVMANFRVYKTIEIALLVGGAGVIVAFRKRPSLVAVAVGCLLQGGAMLVLDLFAEARGRTYLEAIGRE